MNLVDAAMKISFEAHNGQTRNWGGEPYFSHPFAVYLAVKENGGDKIDQCVALLHDVPEDCEDWPIDRVARELDDLTGQQCDKEVKEICRHVRLMTHSHGIPRREYWGKLWGPSKRVKIQDMINNIKSCWKIPDSEEKTRTRLLLKYSEGLDFLL